MTNMTFSDLNRAIINGRANSRVLWQPRIQCWFADRDFKGKPYEAPYERMEITDVYRRLECSNRGYPYGDAVTVFYGDDSVRRSSREIDALRTEERIDTPVGTITSVVRRNTSNSGTFPEKWFVETEEDLKVLTYAEERVCYGFDKTKYARVDDEWHGFGLPCAIMPRVNIQRLFIDYMGVEGTVYALADYTGAVEEYFKAVSRSDKRFMDVIISNGFEWLNFGDNLHGGILSPSLFTKYVLPEYNSRTAYLHNNGLFCFAHWDGDCKTLLPYARETGLDGIEAITPTPQGDVTLKEARAGLGGEMFLVDGIAAVLFDEMYPVEHLMSQVRECIELFPDRLIMGISDEISSTGVLDRVKRVSDYVNNYNAKL